MEEYSKRMLTLISSHFWFTRNGLGDYKEVWGFSSPFTARHCEIFSPSWQKLRYPHDSPFSPSWQNGENCGDTPQDIPRKFRPKAESCVDLKVSSFPNIHFNAGSLSSLVVVKLTGVSPQVPPVLTSWLYLPTHHLRVWGNTCWSLSDTDHKDLCSGEIWSSGILMWCGRESALLKKFYSRNSFRDIVRIKSQTESVEDESNQNELCTDNGLKSWRFQFNTHLLILVKFVSVNVIHESWLMRYWGQVQRKLPWIWKSRLVFSIKTCKNSVR
jgi:hypothetical protein